MIAFVLSGGGNRGALQVGAMQVLFEHGIVPEMLVGTSAGAINAAFVAANPCREQLDRLAELWRQVTKDDVYPGGRLTMLWRLVTGRESLFPNENFYRFLADHLSAGVLRFADITAARLYIVATCLDTGALRLFGEDPEDSVLDAVMASTALPPFHPPWHYGGERYIDGGAVADLPLRVAVEKGAREIYALHATGESRPAQALRNLIAIANQAISALLQQQLAHDLEEAARHPGVRLHHIQLPAPPGLTFWDFSHSAELIEIGRRTVEEYLRGAQVQQVAVRERIASLLTRYTIEPLSRGRALVKDAIARVEQALRERGGP
ncbi:MAG TPA: patatin-like phospholipase family protein [Anaerolineae bacterium]|nr:patatin-like phospholipase family protein [Anaerolineae bacterium]